jgi:hypothetical protein
MITEYCLHRIAKAEKMTNRIILSFMKEITATSESIIVNISVKTKTLVPKKYGLITMKSESSNA